MHPHNRELETYYIIDGNTATCIMELQAYSENEAEKEAAAIWGNIDLYAIAASEFREAL